jgi:hypothetical protein
MLAAFDAADLFKIVVFIVIVIGWIVRSIATQVAEKPVARPRTPQPQPRLPQQPRPQAPDQSASQRPFDPAEEVAEFLRQAQSRRSGSPSQAPMPLPKPAHRPAANQQPNRGQRKPPKPSPRPAARTPLTPQNASSERTGDLGQGVGRHVQEHLSTEDFSQRASRPTNVDVAEDANEARLKQVFSHRVGTLSDVTMPPPEDAPVLRQPVLNLAALLADGDSLRQMIVVNEVLRRPEERW